jgi:hypothetical protein
MNPTNRENATSMPITDILREHGFEVVVPPGLPDEASLTFSGSLDSAAMLMDAAIDGEESVKTAIGAPLVVREDKVRELITLLTGCGVVVRCPGEVDIHHPLAVSGDFQRARAFLALAVDARNFGIPGGFTRRLIQ